MLSFGDPRPHAPAIKAAGCKLICQVQDVEQAQVACEAGADLIDSVESAATLVARISAEAEAQLRAGAGLVR